MQSYKEAALLVLKVQTHNSIFNPRWAVIIYTDHSRICTSFREGPVTLAFPVSCYKFHKQHDNMMHCREELRQIVVPSEDISYPSERRSAVAR